MILYSSMLKTGLEFAPGTTEEAQKLIVRMFQPGELLGWYKNARRTYKSGDLVLVTDARDPSGVTAWPRAKYVEQLRVGMGAANGPRMVQGLTIAHQSAHQVVKLPNDSDAFWLVVILGAQVPSMCVLYASPYEEMATGSAPTV